MATDIEICNFALYQLGKKPISGFTDANPNAEACAALYALARDSVLSDHPWNFATKAVELAAISDADYPGYDYAYAYPADCLRALELVNEASTDELPFEVAATDDLNGRVILCDYETATLRYIARATNPSLYSPLFSQSLGYALAAQMSQTLVGAADRMRDLVAMYERTVQKAAARDCQEGRQGPREDNPYIDARA